MQLLGGHCQVSYFRGEKWVFSPTHNSSEHRSGRCLEIGDETRYIR